MFESISISNIVYVVLALHFSRSGRDYIGWHYFCDVSVLF